MSGCLCPLAREIGFDVRWIRQQYYISKVMYNVTLMQQSTHGTVKQRRKGRASAKLANKPHNTATSTTATSSTSSYSPLFDAKVRTMTSIAVQDRLLPDSFHLLTNGDPLLTFRHCSAYWDGDNIKPVDDGIASSFQSILQQWWHQDLHCIAFAYTPIPSLYYALLMDEAGREREYIIDTWQEAAGWERKPERAGVDGGSEPDSRGGSGVDETKDERRYGRSDMETMREDAREDDEAVSYGGVHDADAREYDAKVAQQLGGRQRSAAGRGDGHSGGGDGTRGQAGAMGQSRCEQHGGEGRLEPRGRAVVRVRRLQLCTARPAAALQPDCCLTAYQPEPPDGPPLY